VHGRAQDRPSCHMLQKCACFEAPEPELTTQAAARHARGTAAQTRREKHACGAAANCRSGTRSGPRTRSTPVIGLRGLTGLPLVVSMVMLTGHTYCVSVRVTASSPTTYGCGSPGCRVASFASRSSDPS